MKLRRLKRWHGRALMGRVRCSMASEKVPPMCAPRQDLEDALYAFFVEQFHARRNLTLPK